MPPPTVLGEITADLEREGVRASTTSATSWSTLNRRFPSTPQPPDSWPRY
jgi:hypothetical protein